MSSVYSDIGLSTTESRQTAVQQAAKTGSSKISQEDFLKMLTTELSYQDPTNPSDNNQMVAQLSQLSMVDGINSLNSTVTDLQGSVASGESLMASSLVGQNVLLQTPIAYNNGTGIAGEITTGDTGASDITVMVTASSGQVVYQQSFEVPGRQLHCKRRRHGERRVAEHPYQYLWARLERRAGERH